MTADTSGVHPPGPAEARTAFFTICSNNYMPHAKVLAATVRRHHPGVPFFVCLADEPIEWPGLYDEALTVVPARAIGVPDYDSFTFRYDILELNTALKPFMFLHLMGCRSGTGAGFGGDARDGPDGPRTFDRVVYLDPDIAVFAPLGGVLDALEGGASFVLTPHLYAPAEGDAAPDDPGAARAGSYDLGRFAAARCPEAGIMRAGAYNLGFLAAARCPEAVRVLRWWARRLRFYCVTQPEDGLFVDQKFMDLVPGFAPAARINHDPALNVAYWNLAQADLDDAGEGWTVGGVGGCPLGFFHFSGFDAHRPERLSKFTRRFQADPPPLRRLLAWYAERLLAEGYGTVPSAAYAYGAFRSGTPIPAQVRRMFRDETPDWPGDPFETYEAYLHLPAPGTSRASSAFVVTRLMLLLWGLYPALYTKLDPARADHAEELVRWYLEYPRRGFGFDPRLIEPVAARVGHRPPARPAPAAETGRAEACVVGYLRAASGTGEVGRRTLRALAATGLRVEGLDVALNVHSARDDRGCEALLAERGTGRVQVFANVNADQLPLVLEHLRDRLRPDAYRVAMPAWELEEFPDAWLPAFEGVDEVWAQSAWVQAGLARKLGKPVVRMPVALALDPVAPVRRVEYGLPEDRFLFFFAFDALSYPERKNPRGVLDAFRRVRRGLPGRVGLVLKTMNGAARPDVLAALRDEAADDPDVVRLDASLSRAEASGLLAACDAAVSLHRAEGLGLLVAEAMAQGKPVVATDYSATTELVRPGTGYPVGFRLVPVPPGAYPMGEGQRWADPDLDHAAWLMRRVVLDPAEAASRAAVARRRLDAEYGPAAVAARQRARLAELGIGRRGDGS